MQDREGGVAEGRAQPPFELSRRADLPQLGELLMVSQVDLLDASPSPVPPTASFEVQVGAARGVRCDRCWNHREDTAPGPRGGVLCGRCRDVLARLG